MPSQLKGPCSQGNIREILITTTRQNYSPNMTRPKSTTSQQLWSITQFFSAFSKENIFQMVLVRNIEFTLRLERERGGEFISCTRQKNPIKFQVNIFLSLSFHHSMHHSVFSFFLPSLLASTLPCLCLKLALFTSHMWLF